MKERVWKLLIEFIINHELDYMTTKLPMGKVARIASVILGVAMFASVALPASASTIDDLLAQIASLQAQLLALQSGTSTSCNFTMNLSMGQSNPEVLALQKYLNAHGSVVSTTGAGAPGQETSYFGARTKAAVIHWQNTYAAQVLAPAGLSAGTGFWGMYSRAYANTTCGGTVVVPPPPGVPPTGGSATVTAGTQPAASLAPQSAARVPFTRFTVSTGATAITLNSVEVDRTGLAQDAVFSGIVLLDGNGIQLGIAKTLNSLHHVTVGAPIVIPANSSMTFTVAGNMAASLTAYAGQVASLSVVGLNTDGTVSGSFPITGAGQTINASLTLGSATLNLSAFDPNTAVTKSVGDMGVKFAGVRITAGSAEAMRLWSIRWNQSGSAAAGDMSNLMTYVDGTAYPVVVSSDGKYFTTTFGSGIVIDKGLSKEIYIQGDITGSGSAARTVEFDLYKNTDVYLTGETYGYGSTPAANGACATAATTASEFIYSAASCTGTAGTPFFSGSVITIQAGTATTISKAPEVASQNIAVNVPNQVLGGYAALFTGEPVTVQSSVFSFATSSGAGNTTGLLTSVSIYNETGTLVAGPVDAVACTTNSGTQCVTFTDSITYPVGRHIYTIKGKVPTNVANGVTYIASTNPSSDWTNVTGQITGNSISLSGNSLFAMNTMTVRAAALAVAISTTPAAQNVVAGAQGVTYANYQLDASQSGEDIRVSNITPQVIYANTPTTPEISSCQLWDGATAITTGSNVYNPSGSATTSSTMTRTFTFDNSIVVTKGTTKTLAMKCNLSGSAQTGGQYRWGIAAVGTANVSATGVTSSGTVTATGPANSGQIMTVSAAGTLVAATDPSSPGYSIVWGGQTGVTAGVIQFHATNEDITITRIGLRLTGAVTTATTIASTSPADLVSVYLYDGATLIGTAQFNGNDITATSTLNTGVTVTRDSNKLITIKADYGDISPSSAAVEGHHVKIDVDANGTNTQGNGLMSGTTINSTGSTAFAGQRLFGSYPVVAQDTLPGTGMADGRLIRFKITAVSKTNDSDVGLYQFKFVISTTTPGAVSAVNLFGYTDAQYSQPISGVSAGGQFMAANQAPGTAGALTITAQDSSGTATQVQVPQGATRYFELKGTTVSGTNANVTTVLSGDAAYPVLGTTSPGGATSPYQGAFVTTAGGLSGSNLVWSPNGTTTATYQGLDWTNGFGVQGLPQSGFTQSRTP